jgi:hypothetical protein
VPCCNAVQVEVFGRKNECDLLGGGMAAVWAHHVNVRTAGSGTQRAPVFSQTWNIDTALECMHEGARDDLGTSAMGSRFLTVQLPPGTRGRRKRGRLSFGTLKRRKRLADSTGPGLLMVHRGNCA